MNGNTKFFHLEVYFAIEHFLGISLELEKIGDFVIGEVKDETINLA